MLFFIHCISLNIYSFIYMGGDGGGRPPLSYPHWGDIGALLNSMRLMAGCHRLALWRMLTCGAIAM